MMMLMTKMMLVILMMMTRPMMMMHLQKRTGFNDNDDNEDDADDEDDDEADADAEDEDDEDADDAPAEKRPGCVQLDEVDVGPTLAVHFLHNYLQLSFFLSYFRSSFNHSVLCQSSL